MYVCTYVCTTNIQYINNMDRLINWSLAGIGIILKHSRIALFFIFIIKTINFISYPIILAIIIHIHAQMNRARVKTWLEFSYFSAKHIKFHQIALALVYKIYVKLKVIVNIYIHISDMCLNMYVNSLYILFIYIYVLLIIELLRYDYLYS